MTGVQTCALPIYKERRNPKLIDGQRRKRIALGSGMSVQEVNRIIKMHDSMKDMMKMMRGTKGRGLAQMMGGRLGR